MFDLYLLNARPWELWQRSNGDGLRYSLIVAGTFSLLLDFVVLAVSCAVMLGLGAYLFDIGELN
jgi:hypothetical protein